MIKKVGLSMFKLQKSSCYEIGRAIEKGALLIALEEGNDFGLTHGRIYQAISNQGENTFHDCVFVVNDNGEKQDTSVEYFAFYEGEILKSQ